MHVERIYCDSLAHSSWQTRVLFIGVWRSPHPNQKVGGSRKLEVYNGGSQACEWSEGYNHSTGINPNPPPPAGICLARDEATNRRTAPLGRPGTWAHHDMTTKVTMIIGVLYSLLSCNPAPGPHWARQPIRTRRALLVPPLVGPSHRDGNLNC